MGRRAQFQFDSEQRRQEAEARRTQEETRKRELLTRNGVAATGDNMRKSSADTAQVITGTNATPATADLKNIGTRPAGWFPNNTPQNSSASATVTSAMTTPQAAPASFNFNQPNAGVDPAAAARTRNAMRAAGVFSTSQEHAPSGPLPFTTASTAPLPANPGPASPDYPKYLAAVESQRSGALAARGQGVQSTFTDPQRDADTQLLAGSPGRVIATPAQDEADQRMLAGTGKNLSTPYGTASSRTTTWQEQLASKYPAFHQAGSSANTAFVSAIKAAKIDPNDQSAATGAKVHQIADDLAKNNPADHVAANGSFPSPSKPLDITNTNFGTPNLAKGTDPFSTGGVTVNNPGVSTAPKAPFTPVQPPGFDFSAQNPTTPSTAANSGTVNVGGVSATSPTPLPMKVGNIAFNQPEASDVRVARTTPAPVEPVIAANDDKKKKPDFNY